MPKVTARIARRSRMVQSDPAASDTDGPPTLAETMKRHGNLEDRLEDVEGIVSKDAKTTLY